MFAHNLIGLTVCTGLLVAGMPASATELTILWADWDPANCLQELANEYEKETGVKVTVKTVAWSNFQTKAFASFIDKSDNYDMVVGDSQWLGLATTQGHYFELSDFVRDYKLNEIMANAMMTNLSEYPKGSGHYWAVPLEADAIGWAYRKDWFDEPSAKQAFRAKYHYELAAPKTWKELQDIAEFFYRPNADPPQYGIAIYTSVIGDSLAMGYTTVLYSYGGDIGNRATCAVEGIINSPLAVEALQVYGRLYRVTPPNWTLADTLQDNLAITVGLAAMSMNYFAFFPSLVNPSVNSHADHIGFFRNPAGPTGDSYSALGGQGISIVSYSSKKEESMKFLGWVIRADTQQKWADLGGLTPDATIMRSEKFRNASPYNEAFYQSMFAVKDFWALPYYTTLLEQMNRRIASYVLGGEVSAKQALDGLAADWMATIKQHGCK